MRMLSNSRRRVCTVQSCRKGIYKTGDYAIYIPEQAILPDELIDELILTGKLAGPGYEPLNTPLAGPLYTATVRPERDISLRRRGARGCRPWPGRG